jgi:acyl carrier protein
MMTELFGIDAAQVVPQAHLIDDLDLDSIDAIDMVVRLQEVTGRRVAEEELRSLRTVGDIVALVQAYMNTPQPGS